MARSFSETYLGKLRAKVGDDCLLVIGFRCVIQDGGGRILLLKRSDSKLWGLPSGSAEPGESIADCIQREVLEETGLNLQAYEAYGFASDPKTESHTYPNGHRIHGFSLLVFSRKWTGILNPIDGEAEEVRFFDQAELPDESGCVRNEMKSLSLFLKYQSDEIFQWS